MKKETRIKVKDVCRCFQMYPSYLSSLQARGHVPDRGTTDDVTFILAIEAWYRNSHNGIVPPAAQELIDRVVRESKENGQEDHDE